MPFREFELTAKKLELTHTQNQIVDREKDLAHTSEALADFQFRYTNSVGCLYRRLDQIYEEIASILDAGLPSPGDLPPTGSLVNPCPIPLSSSTGLIKRSSMVRYHADSSHELVSLFRRAAVKLHPDLASDDQERERRCRAMAQINSAYELGDYESIDWILSQWESTSGHVAVDDISNELNCVIRHLSQAKKRLAQLEQKIVGLKSTEWYKLFQKERYFSSRGKDLIKLLSSDVKREIAHSKKVLKSIRKEKKL